MPPDTAAARVTRQEFDEGVFCQAGPGILLLIATVSCTAPHLPRCFSRTLTESMPLLCWRFLWSLLGDSFWLG
jgi:hypothetical protein